MQFLSVGKLAFNNELKNCFMKTQSLANLSAKQMLH